MRARTDLSEDEIVAVLGRAAEIDARGRSATPDDLVQWAGEAGISAEAVKAALLELHGAVGVAVIGILAMSKARSIRRRFQILNALVWGCFISGWSIANGVATEDIVVLGLVAGVSTSIAGGIVTHVMDRRSKAPAAER